jgi:hypothetical protein
MQPTEPLHTEPLQPIVFTTSELIAIGAAITTYRKWLTHSPESASEQSETITLLDRFLQRLMQPGSYIQEVRS